MSVLYENVRKCSGAETASSQNARTEEFVFALWSQRAVPQTAHVEPSGQEGPVGMSHLSSTARIEIDFLAAYARPYGRETLQVWVL